MDGTTHACTETTTHTLFHTYFTMGAECLKQSLNHWQRSASVVIRLLPVYSVGYKTFHTMATVYGGYNNIAPQGTELILVEDFVLRDEAETAEMVEMPRLVLM